MAAVKRRWCLQASSANLLNAGCTVEIFATLGTNNSLPWELLFAVGAQVNGVFSEVLTNNAAVWE